jgi:hypothetical protein
VIPQGPKGDPGERGAPGEKGEDVHTAVPVILVIILVLLVLLTVAGAMFGADLRDQGEETRASAYATRATAQSSCFRNNDSRAKQIETILKIEEGNRERAAAWESLEGRALPPSILAFAEAQQKANAGEAADLHTLATEIAEAQRDVAVNPDAKDLAERSVVDCEAVNPLPNDPTDPLPEPTLPAK